MLFIGRKRFPFNKALRILLFTNGLILIAAAMFGPITALFVEKVGGSLLDASFAGGVYALAAGITVFLSGKYSDRIKQQELVVVIGYAIMGVGFLLYTKVDSVWSLLAVQALIGFGEAFYSPSFDAVYSKHLTYHKEGSQWGAWESINYFTATAGAIIGGAIVTAFDFNALFIAMAVLAFASALYIFRLPRSVL